MLRFYSAVLFLVLWSAQVHVQAQTFTQVSDPACTTPTAADPYRYSTQAVISNLTISHTSTECAVGVSYSFTLDLVVTMSGTRLPPDPSGVSLDLALIIRLDGNPIWSGVFGGASVADGPKTISTGNWEGVMFCPGVNVLTVEIDENTSVWNGPCIQNDPLPIELGYFEPELLEEGAVKVQWQTLSETNNDYFILSRSYDGTEWEQIAQVPGSGDTRGAVVYEYMDYAPFYGVNYYQLTQVDFDGVSETFSMKWLINENASDIRVFPNPVSQTLFLQGYYSPLEEVYLSDLQGNKIKLVRTAHSSGLNQYTLPPLAQGMYIVEVYDAGYQRILTEKVLVQTP